MRVLYNNVATEAAITTTSENVNFPLGNLFVPALSTPYRSLATPVDLYLTFDVEEAINCISLAGHNLTTLRYRVYDIGDNIVEDVSLLEVEPTAMIYLSQSTAKKIRLTMNSDETYISIGALFTGMYYQMPYPIAYYDETIEMTNERFETAFGQVFGSDGEFLQTYSPEFVNITMAQFNAIKTMLQAVRNFVPLFVDMTEDAHEYKAPLYCTVSLDSIPNSRYVRANKIDGQKRTISLKIREAK